MVEGSRDTSMDQQSIERSTGVVQNTEIYVSYVIIEGLVAKSE